MAGQVSFLDCISSLHISKANWRSHQPSLRFRPAEGDHILHFVAEGKVQRLHVHRSRLSAPVATRGACTRVRNPLEGHFAQPQSPIAHFHRPSAVDADPHITTLSLPATHTRHGEENGLPYFQRTIWQPEALPRLVPTSVPVDPRVSIAALRPNPLYCRSHPSVQRSSLLWHNTALGRSGLATNHLYSSGGCCQR